MVHIVSNLSTGDVFMVRVGADQTVCLPERAAGSPPPATIATAALCSVTIVGATLISDQPSRFMTITFLNFFFLLLHNVCGAFARASPSSCDLLTVDLWFVGALLYTVPPPLRRRRRQHNGVHFTYHSRTHLSPTHGLAYHQSISLRCTNWFDGVNHCTDFSGCDLGITT